MANEVMVKGIIPIPQQELILMIEASELLLKMGQDDKCKNLLQGVASLVPTSDVPWVLIGNYYYQKGNIKSAQKYYEKALSQKPKSALASAHIGEILMHQKRFKESIKFLDKAIDLDPRGSCTNFAKAVKQLHEKGGFN